MRALTLYRPWTDLITRCPLPFAKRVENRTWAPPLSVLGETIALHAGRTYDEDGATSIALKLMGTRCEWTLPEDEESPQGIVGLARIVGFKSDQRLGFMADMPGRLAWTRRLDQPFGFGLSDTEKARERAVLALPHDRWWTGPYGWLLDEVVAIEPIACVGARGLWPVPERVATEVAAAARVARGETRRVGGG